MNNVFFIISWKWDVTPRRVTRSVKYLLKQDFKMYNFCSLYFIVAIFIHFFGYFERSRNKKKEIVFFVLSYNLYYSSSTTYPEYINKYNNKRTKIFSRLKKYYRSFETRLTLK